MRVVAEKCLEKVLTRATAILEVAAETAEEDEAAETRLRSEAKGGMSNSDWESRQRCTLTAAAAQGI